MDFEIDANHLVEAGGFWESGSILINLSGVQSADCAFFDYFINVSLIYLLSV